MAVCYIVGAGEFHGSLSPSSDDFVIAADGGFDTLISHGVRCDLLIGDFDSIEELPEGTEAIRFPVEKDDTDTFLAYREGVKRGFREFEIYGGCGGSEDHTYANLCLLHYASTAGHRATLHGESTRSFVLTDGTVTLRGKCGKRLSVFAVGGDASGVSISGAKYEVQDITLTPAFPLGVSNSYLGGECKISVRQGSLLIMSEI